MAITLRVVGDRVERTETREALVSTMSREEIEGKTCEIQTKIDHLDIDRAVYVAEIRELNNLLALLGE